VRGLINVQYAVAGDVLYVLEANPRASPHGAVRLQGDRRAAGQGRGAGDARRDHRRAAREGCCPPTGDGGTCRRRADRGQGGGAAVQPVPHPRGQVVDTVLGPEMRSTGEVMGIDADFGTAFAKSQAAAYGSLPTKGKVFVSIANRDKRAR
jgi:carbamoyl-phosphate synthase large subunit